jgi:hypothetical protein
MGILSCGLAGVRSRAARRARPFVSSRLGAQLEALDFTRCRLGKLVDELDPARIFVRREPLLDVLAQLLRQRGSPARPPSARRTPSAHELVVACASNHRGLEDGPMSGMTPIRPSIGDT